jgi:hypothetical protein
MPKKLAGRKTEKAAWVRFVISQVIQYLGEKAEFRERMAAEHPDSVGKNGGYADSLRRMIDYIGSLPVRDPSLQKLARAAHRFYDEDADVLELPPGAGNEAIHCGPRGKPIDTADPHP